MAWNDPSENALQELKHPLDSEDIVVDEVDENGDNPYYDPEEFMFIGAEELEGW
jgi:hypothetical protein